MRDGRVEQTSRASTWGQPTPGADQEAVPRSSYRCETETGVVREEGQNRHVWRAAGTEAGRAEEQIHRLPCETAGAPGEERTHFRPKVCETGADRAVEQTHRRPSSPVVAATGVGPRAARSHGLLEADPGVEHSRCSWGLVAAGTEAAGGCDGTEQEHSLWPLGRVFLYQKLAAPALRGVCSCYCRNTC